MRKYIITISAALFLFLLAGCTIYTESADDAEAGICWIVDPEGGQVLKIASGNNTIEAYNDTDVGRPISVVHNPYNGYTWVGDGDGRVILLTGRAQVNRTIYGFDEPAYMALFPKEGSVWILDTGYNRVIKMGHRGTLELELDGYPDGRGITVDPVSGDVFVAQANKVTRLNYKGETLGTFGGFADIADLEYDGAIERLWVIDSGAGTFTRLTNDGIVEETVSGQIEDPRDITINPILRCIYVAGIQDGLWYVAKYKLGTDGSGGIKTGKVWEKTGVKELRDPEAEEDDFFSAVTIACSPNDAGIWINDYGNHRLIKATDDGDETATLVNIMGGFFAPSDMTIITNARR